MKAGSSLLVLLCRTVVPRGERALQFHVICCLLCLFLALLRGPPRPNREFWEALRVVCDDKVAKAKALLGENEDGVATGGLHKV